MLKQAYSFAVGLTGDIFYSRWYICTSGNDLKWYEHYFECCNILRRTFKTTVLHWEKKERNISLEQQFMQRNHQEEGYYCMGGGKRYLGHVCVIITYERVLLFGLVDRRLLQTFVGPGASHNHRAFTWTLIRSLGLVARPMQSKSEVEMRFNLVFASPQI